MKQKGFTLIELLVVISIIGVLAGIMFASFSGIQQKARDGQRKSDLKQIQAALELYRADNGGYPRASTNPEVVSSLASFLSTGTPVYLKTIPNDPEGLCPYYYGSANPISSTSVDNNYSLYASIENTNDPSVQSPLPTPVAPPVPTSPPGCTYNYIINNP